MLEEVIGRLLGTVGGQKEVIGDCRWLQGDDRGHKGVKRLSLAISHSNPYDPLSLANSAITPYHPLRSPITRYHLACNSL